MYNAKNTRRLFSHRTWLLEALAIIICVCSQSSIVIILFSMKDKPLSHWTSSISITATISILTTISKSMLLFVVGSCISQYKWQYFLKPRRLFDFDVFDAASRGPLGASQFLLQKTLYKNVAILGALITILALAVDPSAQLMVELNSQIVPLENSKATFSHSTIYDSGVRYSPAGPSSIYTQDITMISAVINGLFGVALHTPFSCPSANCTWPGEYTTLGFESKCTNVTTTSKRVCTNQIDGIDDDIMPYTGDYQFCNITTPGGIVLKTLYHPTEHRTAVNVSALCAGSGPGHFEASPAPNYTCSPMVNTSTISTFAVYRYSAVSYDDLDDIAPWEAIECTIDVAAFTYSNITVKNSIFEFGSTKVTPLSPVLANESNGLFNFNNTVNLNFTGDTDDDIVYQINNADWFFLSRFLFEKVFRGGITAGTTHCLTKHESVAPGVFLSADISKLAADVALSMTNRVRISPNSTMAEGIALRDVTFINVRWEWLLVPLTAVFFGAVFFAVTYGISVYEGTTTWGSSSVALLLHHVDGLGHAERREIGDMNGLEYYSKDARVQLARNQSMRLERVNSVEQGVIVGKLVR